MNPNFDGDITSYVENVSLMKLGRNFELNNFVQTVCLSPIHMGNNQLVSVRMKLISVLIHSPYDHNCIGIITQIPGWGLSEERLYSDQLKEGHFRPLDMKSCPSLSPSLTFFRFFNYDKFCVLTGQG